MRITKKMLKQVPPRVREDYEYWRRRITQAFKFGDVGEGELAMYREARAKVLASLMKGGR